MQLIRRTKTTPISKTQVRKTSVASSTVCCSAIPTPGIESVHYSPKLSSFREVGGSPSSTILFPVFPGRLRWPV